MVLTEVFWLFKRSWESKTFKWASVVFLKLSITIFPLSIDLSAFTQPVRLLCLSLTLRMLSQRQLSMVLESWSSWVGTVVLLQWLPPWQVVMWTFAWSQRCISNSRVNMESMRPLLSDVRLRATVSSWLLREQSMDWLNPRKLSCTKRWGSRRKIWWRMSPATSSQL